MALITMCRKICASRRLIETPLNRRLMCMFNTNLRPAKKAPFLKNKFAVIFLPKRNLFGLFKRPTKAQLKVLDDVPDQYTLIYRNTMDRYILYAQIISTVTAFIVILTTIIKHDLSNVKLDLSKWDYPARATDNEIYVYMTAFIGIIVILQLLVSRLPIRIYYLSQQKNYIFVFHGNYPFTYRKLSCKIGDVVPLPEKGISPWKQGRYMIKDNQKVILMDQYFRRSADLYIMLGVQRDHDADERD